MFLAIYDQLPEISAKFIEIYSEVVNKYLGITEIKCALGIIGGRIIPEKALRIDSDIDIVFIVQDDDMSIEHLHSDKFGTNSLDIKNLMMKELKENITTYLQNLNILSKYFEIKQFGNVNKNINDLKETIIIAKTSNWQ